MKKLTTKIMLLLMVTTTAWAGTPNSVPYQPIRPDQVPSGTNYEYHQLPISDSQLLRGKRVAILASHGVEELEFLAPYEYLTQMGATVEVIVPSWTPEGIVASRFLQPTLFIKATATFAQALHQNYDLLVLTGGAWNAQVVRSDIEALTLIIQHYNQGKPIGAICAGTVALINAGIANGLTMTGSPPVQTDLINAGARFVNQSLVITGNIATSRSPEDAADFVRGLRYLLVGF